MADIAAQGGMAGTGGTLSPRTALRLAWVTWAVFLVIPFFLFLSVVWILGMREEVTPPIRQHAWFLGASIYLLVAVPLSFFWRGHVFKAYWSGQPIAPKKYLYGMLGVWAALVFGGIFGLLGCFVDRSLLPNLLPALVAFMFYVTLWPSGRAMVGRTGKSEDPGKYEEPR
ncbi:MAG TPA: hypothetical protein VHX86_11015 [Tepidisphaeraceae bacterium]|jgi:hypothetical protein|nr:hypothetical protein [Tepidisphaeraceae bacterium]